MRRLQQGWFLALLSLATLAYTQSKGGRWQFENNGLDTATWDIVDDNGTLQNLAGFDTQAPLQEGSVYLWLDSANVHDYFRVEDSDDLDFDNENVGISAWIYPIHLERVHFIITKGDQLPIPKTTNYSLRISEGKNLEFLLRDARDRAQRVTSSFTIPLNQWTFVAAFYDYNARKVYLWNDPARPAVDTLNFNQAIFSNNAPLAIGSWFRSDPASPSINDFEGRIDEVRISGRVEDLFPLATSIISPATNTHAPIAAEISIYPNPAKVRGNYDAVSVQIGSGLENANSIGVYNILGEIVFAAAINNSTHPFHFIWNLRDKNGNLLKTGIYWIRVDNGRNALTKKFIVIK